MRSMTGFGQANGRNARHAVTVTLRSVNHRFFDLKLRLADELRGSEPALTALLAGEVERGRLDAGVEMQALGEREVTVDVHRPVVLAAHSAFEALVEGGLISQGLTAGDLLRLSEAVTLSVAPDRWEAEDHELLLAVARQALAQLVAGRETEGTRLAALLAERLDGLAAAASDLVELTSAARDQEEQRLRARLAEILAAPPPSAPGGRAEGEQASGARLDPWRLEQEVALLAERGDVAEELDRLGAHVGHFREVTAAAGAVGKRLDFLTQEILRELNTLGAKCRDPATTRRVLDAKLLCEQLREQVQNVE